MRTQKTPFNCGKTNQRFKRKIAEHNKSISVHIVRLLMSSN